MKIKVRFLHSTFYILNSRKGFTLLEMVIFSAILATSFIAFVTILITVLNVQVRQQAVAEVNQQSQFLLQTVQSLVEESSLVEMTENVATTTMRLRMSVSSTDPTRVFASGTQMFIQQSSTAPQALTSSRVTISNLSFVKRANPPGHDSVALSFTTAYNTSNTKQFFQQFLNFAVARVSAATFDSNISASSSGWSLGTASGEWKSINGTTIQFTGLNVGIGVLPTNARLQVGGGALYIDTAGVGSGGLVMKAPGGACWELYIPNSGVPTTTLYGGTGACP